MVSSQKPRPSDHEAGHIDIIINPLMAELNPICHLLALLGAHHIFHVTGLRINVTIALPARTLNTEFL